jgi:hypothetical protein
MAPGRSLFPLRLDTWVLGNVEQTDADGQNKTKNLLITFLSCSFFRLFFCSVSSTRKKVPLVHARIHSPPPIIIFFCLPFRTLALCTSFSLLILLFLVHPVFLFLFVVC